MSLDIIVHTFTLAFITLLGWAGKKIFVEPLEKHIDECNKMPKSLILEKIEALTLKVDQNHEDVKEEIKLQRERYHDLNNFLTTIKLRS